MLACSSYVVVAICVVAVVWLFLLLCINGCCVVVAVAVAVALSVAVAVALLCFASLLHPQHTQVNVTAGNKSSRPRSPILTVYVPDMELHSLAH